MKRSIAVIMFICLLITSTIRIMPLKVYADDKEYHNPGDNFTRTQYFLSNKLKITNPVLYTTNEGGAQGIFVADVENISSVSTEFETFDIVFYDEDYIEIKCLSGIISPINPSKTTKINISWTCGEEIQNIKYYQLVNKETGETSSFNYVWDGVKKTEVVSINGVYTIDTPDELAWFAQEVNSGNTFIGKSIFITGEMNLGNNTWDPIGNGKILECSIEIKNCYISGMTSNVLNNGLFDNVSVKRFIVDNLRIDNASIIKDSWDTHNLGLLAGAITIPLNGYLEVKNSEFRGTLSNTHNFDYGFTGGVIGKLTFEAENGYAVFENNVVEANISGSNAVGGMFGFVVDADLLGTLEVNKCYIDCTISASNSYGYEDVWAGGITGILNGDNVSISQCTIKGSIHSSAYEGYCGGLAGHCIYNSLKISDCCVQASINSIFSGWYGSMYNGAGFLGLSHCKDNANSYIKNSYFNGPINSGVAFVTRDDNGGDSSIPIINCYFDMDKTGLAADMMHSYGKYAGLMTNVLSGCAGYTSEQMKNLTNFIGWDFEKIWVMDSNAPRIRTSDELVENQYIIQRVAEYTTDELYAQYKEIDKSNESMETKARKLYELFMTHGFTDPKEGIQYLSNVSNKRSAYLYLTTDEIFCASNFQYWLDNTANGLMTKGLLVLDGWLLAGELNDYADFTTYLESDYPSVKKYKAMLYDFMESAKEKIIIESYINTIIDLGKLSKHVTAVGKSNAEKLVAELNKCTTEMEVKNILSKKEYEDVLIESATSFDENGNPIYSFKLDEKSGFGQFSKALGYSTKIISFTDMLLSDVKDIIELDSTLAVYAQYKQFLHEIVHNFNLPYEMRWAASQILDEMEDKYLGAIIDLAMDIIGKTELTGIVLDGILEKFGAESISTFLTYIEIGSFFTNKIADIEQMVKYAAYVEGYAYLSDEYKKTLEAAKIKFIDNPTEKNAWDFYYNYNILYQLRYKGEQAYLEMTKVEGIASYFTDFGYSLKKEVVNDTLNHLKNNCQFLLDESVEVPESCQFASKAVIRCPVNVEIYTPDNQLITTLYDGIESDISNEFGRFAVIYNGYTDDYIKVIGFNNDLDYKIKVVAKEDGMVSMSYVDKIDGGCSEFVSNNIAIQKNTILEMSTLQIIKENTYNVDVNGDGSIDYTGDFEVKKEASLPNTDASDNREIYMIIYGISSLFFVMLLIANKRWKNCRIIF